MRNGLREVTAFAERWQLVIGDCALAKDFFRAKFFSKFAFGAGHSSAKFLVKLRPKFLAHSKISKNSGKIFMTRF